MPGTTKVSNGIMTYQRTKQQPPASYLSDEDHYLKYGYRNRTSDQGEPLISRVTNAWKDEKLLPHTNDDTHDEQYPECCDADSENPYIEYIHRVSRSRRLRRMLVVLLVSSLALYLLWKRYLYPQWAEDNMFMPGLDKKVGGFGVQIPNQFKDYTLVEQLDPRKVPGGEHDPEGKRRLIFVGDIHGCNAQLNKLIKDAVKLNPDTDHVIATGDIVGKGPEPGAVIDSLRKMGASVVRGNWDDRIALMSKTYRSHKKATSKKQAKELATLSELTRDHIRYLNQLPLILHIPAIRPPPTTAPYLQAHMVHENLSQPMTDDIYAVHAGLVPGIPLSRQDPYGIMNMRAIHPFTHVPSANRDEGVAWEKVWNWFQNRVAEGKEMPATAEVEEANVVEERLRVQATRETKESDAEWAFYDPVKDEREQKQAVARKRQGSWLSHVWARSFGQWFGAGNRHLEGWQKQKPKYIVYGHDSKRGLVIKRWTKGLDTGCVNGERLTALIVDAWGRQDLVSVDCSSLKQEST